jgi:hypothetical protein
MLKRLAFIALALSIAVPIQAQTPSAVGKGIVKVSGVSVDKDNSQYSDLRSRLPFPESWKYVSDFRDGDIAPEYAIGDARITPGTHFSVTRNATNPSTVAGATGTVSVNTDSNVARFPKSFANSTNGGNFVRGFMVEGSSQNEITYSCDFTQAIWAKTNVTVGNDSVVGPDGATKTTVTLTASADNGTVLYTIPASGTGRTYSVYIKRKT